MPTVANIQSRIAHLADSGETISGVAIAAGDVTHGANGLKKWPADELRAAAASLEGVELNPLHSEQSVGRVTDAAWDADNEAILYEAEVTDAKLADNVDNFEVSIEAAHASAGTVDTARGEAMLVSDIRFTGMAVVQIGASRSATAEAGEQAALSASDIQANLANDGEMTVPEEYIFDNPGEAVEKAQEMGLEGAGDEITHTRGDGEDTEFMPAASHDELLEMLEKEGELAASAAFEEGDLVRWDVSQGSPGTGRVAAVVTEPGETVTAEGADVTREATEDEAAYKLDDYVGPEAGYDDGVVVKSASEILGAWEDAPEEAMAAAAGGTDDAVSPESGPAEVSTGGEPADSTDRQTEVSTLNMDDNDDPEELRARLSEKDDRIAELEAQVEQLQEERADVAHAYAEALAAGDTVFDEDDLVENFTVAELSEKFESTESATLAETEPEVQSGGDEGGEPDEEAQLGADGHERIEEIDAKLSAIGSTLPDDRVDELREEAAELAGTDSYEAALQEV